MLIAFVLTFCLALPLGFWRRKFSGRSWTIIVALALMLSLLLAFLSVWSVWTPYVTNWSFHGGEYEGEPPWCKLSYPLHLNVYHTPFARLLYDGRSISGDASFSIFLFNAKMLEVNGTFTYPPVFGEVPLGYSLNFPFFNNGEKFFIFLLAAFTLLNFVASLLGVALTYVALKRLGKRRCLEKSLHSQQF
jgi:hypothetical protein